MMRMHGRPNAERVIIIGVLFLNIITFSFLLVIEDESNRRIQARQQRERDEEARQQRERDEEARQQQEREEEERQLLEEEEAIRDPVLAEVVLDAPAGNGEDEDGLGWQEDDAVAGGVARPELSPTFHGFQGFRTSNRIKRTPKRFEN
jgi:hypothetical protein